MQFLKNTALVLFTIFVLVAWLMLPWQGVLGLVLLLTVWLFLLRSGAQARSVAAVGISTLCQRIGSSAVIVVDRKSVV